MRSMKRINNKGFGRVELMIMLGVVAVLIAIGAKFAVDSGKNYSAFKTLANSFANNVSLYKDQFPKETNVYYLNDVIEKGFSAELKNPLDKTEYCDVYESYVEIPKTNNKKVRLLCGNYLLEGTQSKEYFVYEVTEWEDTREEGDNDSNVLYNYKKDGKLILDEYVSEQTFLALFFQNTNIAIRTPFDAEKIEEYEVVIKKVYREKTLLKELK